MDRRKFDHFIISYPKCGRTWLRAMLGASLGPSRGISRAEVFTDSVYRISGFPLSWHDRSDKPKKKLLADKSFYKDKRVVFLVRDPKDVLVSYYYQTYYRRSFDGKVPSISKFIRLPGYGISRIAEFYAMWLHNCDVPRKFMLLKYEDIHAQPNKTLKKTLSFFGFPIIPELVKKAVLFGSFKNMHKLEKKGYFKGTKMSRWRPDGKSYKSIYEMKTRSGKIGEGLEVLQQEDIDFIEKTLVEAGCNLYI